MAAQSISSNEFASLVKQLQGSPNNPALKQLVVKHLPEIRALAQTNSLAMYHLAHIYLPKSGQYKHAIVKAASMGCTNAMLDACKLLVKSGKSSDLKKAAHYLLMIEESKDSYINQHSNALLADCPQLARAMQEQKSHHAGQNAHRFFAVNSEKTMQSVDMKLQKTYKP